MAIRLATEKELKNFNKQWQRCLVAAKLTMKESQIVNIEEAQIVSKLDSDIECTKDITLSTFGTVETKGILKKTPDHYKRVNVVVDNLTEGQCCRDIANVHQLQILKPRSDRIPVTLWNLSSRTLKLKKRTNVANAEASQVVPSLDNSPMQENMYGKDVGNTPESSQPENSFGENDDRLPKILEKLDIKAIELWTEQQQQSVRKLLKEYQHLFTQNLKKLGKTSLVQHGIQLSDKTPFKERYRRMPPHQYEEVRKHLQEMLGIGAIHRSTSPWASPGVLVCKKDGSLQFCSDLRRLNNQTIKDAQS